MGAASIVSVVVSGLAAIAIFLGIFMPAGSMSTDQHDCLGDDPCERVRQTVTWTLQREKIEVRQESYANADAHASGRPASSSVETYSTPWGQRGGDAAGAMAVAGVLGWVGVGLVVVGAIMVLVGRFTHLSVGIIGGALGIVSLFVLGFAVLHAWSNGIDPLGGQIKAAVAGPDHNWATSGPFFGAGLITLLVGAVLALIAGIIGTVPAGYRD